MGPVLPLAQPNNWWTQKSLPLQVVFAHGFFPAAETSMNRANPGSIIVSIKSPEKNVLLFYLKMLFFKSFFRQYLSSDRNAAW